MSLFLIIFDLTHITLPFEMLLVYFQPSVGTLTDMGIVEAHYKYGKGAKEVHTSRSAIEVERKPTLRRDDTLLYILDRNETLLPFLCSP